MADKVAGSLNIMVYDAGGKLAAEYAQVTAPTSARIQYITANYQGSTSTVTDNAGNVSSRSDYLPFGEEIGAGVGSRTTGKAFGGSDLARQKYAGMETDDATGVNHTLWRKDDNLSGRWTSPDPYGGSMSTADPQSFNRYAYVDNDPVNHGDPSGLSLADIGVYQTEDSAEAQAVQTGSDIEQREAIKQQQHMAWFSNLTIQQKISVLMHPGGPVDTSGGDSISNTPSMRQTQTQNDPEAIIDSSLTGFNPEDRAVVDTAIDGAREHVKKHPKFAQKLIDNLRLKGNSSTPESALAGTDDSGGRTGNAAAGTTVIVQNVFDGRNSTFPGTDDNGKATTMSRYFVDHPSVNAVTVGQLTFLGPGFFSAGHEEQIKMMVHERVVHAGFGRSDLDFGSPRHVGAAHIDQVINDNY